MGDPESLFGDDLLQGEMDHRLGALDEVSRHPSRALRGQGRGVRRAPGLPNRSADALDRRTDDDRGGAGRRRGGAALGYRADRHPRARRANAASTTREFAEFERGLLIDRITKGFERKAARGEWLGGPGPFGYRVDSASKTLVPDPNEAAMVRKIFVAYVDEHLGATGLANHLNGAGLRNRGDRLWSNQTVLRVIRNPVYLGKISHGDDVYEGKHPSIVDDNLFCPGTTAARRASRRGRESSAEHFGLPADGDSAVPRMPAPTSPRVRRAGTASTVTTHAGTA